jgi:hypothetical protein
VRVGGKGLVDQGAPAGKGAKSEATYQVVEQPSVVVREEEFAKQLRIARYLAASSLPPSRPLEPASVAKSPKQV